MSSCATVDSFVTRYVDDELDHGARQVVDDHLQRCPGCRARVAAERAASTLLKRRQAELAGACAPPWLRARCAGARATWGAAACPQVLRDARPRPRVQLARWAVAATMLLAVASAAIYRLTVGTPQAIAAELSADHAKCFFLNTVLRTHQSVSEVEGYLRAGFDWEAALPPHPEDVDLQLVGSRPCLYEHGKVAHIMYRHHGVPVSIFMLPGVHYTSNFLHALGHEAVVWADGRRTFVLIAKAPPEQVHEVATFVKASLH